MDYIANVASSEIDVEQIRTVLVQGDSTYPHIQFVLDASLSSLSWKVRGYYRDFNIAVISDEITPTETEAEVTVDWYVSTDFTTYYGEMQLVLVGTDALGETVVKALGNVLIGRDFSISTTQVITQNLFEQLMAQLSSSALKLDQTTPQTITGGVPLLASGRVIDEDHQIVDKAYVDGSHPDHNDLSGLQGGEAGEYYHVTAAEKNVIENTSGTNTGDQDLSGFLKLDQTSPQEITNGIPTLATTRVIDSVNQLVDKKYVDQYALGGSGFNANLYFTTINSDVIGYRKLSYTAEATQTELSVAATTVEQLVRTYLFDSGLGVSVIDGGKWSATYRARVSASQGAMLRFEAFLRHADNSETTLFSQSSDKIVNTAYATLETQVTQPSFNCVSTDRLGVRLYASTTHPAGVTLYTIVGDGNASYINTPLAIRHAQLRDKNGEADVQHMTAAQMAALHAHSNKTALDAVSGTNTGDQDVSGAISTHNTDAAAHSGLLSGYVTDAELAEAVISGVSDGSVTPAKTSFMTKTVNLFNVSGIIYDKRLTPSGTNNIDVMVTDTYFVVSNKIPVKLNAVYTINDYTGTQKYYIYKTNGDYVGGYTPTANGDGTYSFTTPPSGTQQSWLLRFSIEDSLVDLFRLMLVEGSNAAIPSVYIPYGYQMSSDTVPYLLNKSISPDMLDDDLAAEIDNKLDYFAPTLAVPSSIDVLAGSKIELFENGMVDFYDLPVENNVDIYGIARTRRNGRFLIDLSSYLTEQEISIVTCFRDVRTNETSGDTTLKLNVVTAPANPATPKTILMVGDSLTAAGYITEEFKNLLATHGLTNFNFVGRVTSGTNKIEATGGYAWIDYVGSPAQVPSGHTNPFWDSDINDINFTKYMATYCAGANLDYVTVMLGMNDYSNILANRDVNAIKARAEIFLTKLHLQYPNCKVLLVGEHKVAEDCYKDRNVMYITMRSWMTELSKMYEALAKSASYLSYVHYVDMQCRFDSKNNMPYSDEYVNLRSTITSKYCSDYVHPITSGYYQYSDAILAGLFAIT